MKTSLEHLPAAKQRELERVTEVLFEEFDSAMSTVMSDKKKRGRILKIILFGSFARGGWVDDRKSGYKSDFDILVIVNANFLADHRFWEAAEDRLRLHSGIKTPVEFIVETMNTVNSELSNGQYFFSDIRSEGIALYQLKGHELSDPKPLTEEEYRELATEYFEDKLPYAKYFNEIVRKAILDGKLKHAAFLLHQATEYTIRHYSDLVLVWPCNSQCQNPARFCRRPRPKIGRSLAPPTTRRQTKIRASTPSLRGSQMFQTL